ncbi:MAG TPA: universal stress protein [Solirubrobacterales bacterium]|nr:universal stress protein [Solirubrobacterales bacterium]
MRLLVGLDGRDGGHDALELARVLSEGQDGEIVAATVLFGGPLPMEYTVLPSESAKEAEPIFERARAAVGDIEIETRAYGGGSPAALLTVYAEREGCDAIVIGSSHRGALGRVLLGSVAHSLLNGAPRGVFVAPRGYASERDRHQPLRTIAVAYDGSAEAKQALRQAERLALPSNATLEILTVVSPPAVTTVPGGAAGSYAPSYPPEPDEVIEEAVGSVDPKLGARGQRLDGSPAEQIATHCEEGVDLLVIGSRGYGPLTRVLLGSVSRRLADEAPCPVLVVPRP